MDLRTQTSLLAAALAMAIAASVVLRARRRRVHWLFFLFGTSIGLWYLTTFLERLAGQPVWQRINLFCAILLPIAGVQFFRAFVDEQHRRMVTLYRIAVFTAAVLVILILTPLYSHLALKSALFTYVLVVLAMALAAIYTLGRNATSRFEGARLRYLALVGAFAATFTLVDYLPYVGLDIPPVGTVLTLIFLYVLSQSVLRYRLLDLYELAGRLTVLTALAFTLATIFWALVELAGGRFFLHSVGAALVILLMFDPLRARVEEYISQVFFRERYDLERTVTELRRRVAHVLEIDAMARVLLEGLERSRRITHGAIYLVDEDQRGYDLSAHVGPPPAARIEIAPARPVLDRLRREGTLVIENVSRELDDRRNMGEEREAETLFEIRQTLEALQASVCIAIQGERGDIYGLLCVRDERLKDAFTPEELQLLRGLATQAAIGVENSRLYDRMKERDRLAALGAMAAGLAHEIRNPLGAIKASAQFLAEPSPEGSSTPSSQNQDAHEFLGIIVEEVDRLNRVVSSFLDYARPEIGDALPIDVNTAVQRTMQLLGPECQNAGVETRVKVDDNLPQVRIDVEQLRQVLINLVHNAVQAMDGGGDLRVETRATEAADVHGALRRWVEILVRDTGPGIPQRVLANLFVPFVTTKDRGTGLGLAISQRIVTRAGGYLKARSQHGEGTTLTVRLPAAEEGAADTVRRPSRPIGGGEAMRTPIAAIQAATPGAAAAIHAPPNRLIVPGAAPLPTSNNQSAPPVTAAAAAPPPAGTPPHPSAYGASGPPPVTSGSPSAGPAGPVSGSGEPTGEGAEDRASNLVAKR